MKDGFIFLDNICDTYIQFDCFKNTNELFKTGSVFYLNNEMYELFRKTISSHEGFPDRVMYRGFVFGFKNIDKDEI